MFIVINAHKLTARKHPGNRPRCYTKRNTVKLVHSSWIM